ncbi:MAG: 4'-phosphopantetheinyl transferase superfamily protein [Alcanivoracaceae bacterium]|nr:4'-phosphopantetheinyl transferase superfamily protein [Alcanivoracaceae bacterium]
MDASQFIHFVSCEFNLDNYHPEQFDRLKIFLPEEIRRSVAKRQAEFLVGRFVATKALLRSGFVDSSTPIIAIGKNREPIWPNGYVGSITHNKNTAICAIDNIETTSLLGIDVETILDDETASEIASQIHDEVEKFVLVDNGFTSNQATTLIFSAKEAIFKALYPIVQEFFGFESFRVKYIDIHRQIITFTMSVTFPYKSKLQENYIIHYQRNKDQFLTSLIVGR